MDKGFEFYANADIAVAAGCFLQETNVKRRTRCASVAGKTDIKCTKTLLTLLYSTTSREHLQ